MEQIDIARRVGQLKSKIPFSQMSDTDAGNAITLAYWVLCQHTTITADLGEELDSLVVDIASMRLNREGFEGMASASQGGVSSAFQDWTDDLQRRTWQYREVICP